MGQGELRTLLLVHFHWTSCSFSFDTGSRLHEGQGHLGVKLSCMSAVSKCSGTIWWINGWVYYNMSSSLTWAPLKATVEASLPLPAIFLLLYFSHARSRVLRLPVGPPGLHFYPLPFLCLSFSFILIVQLLFSWPFCSSWTSLQLQLHHFPPSMQTYCVFLGN